MKINVWIGLFLFIIVFCTSSLASLAQVTIGSGFAPIKGALLQLKENDSSGANSTKGLGLPRVTLTALNGLEDVGVRPTEKEVHVGLLIFSAKDNFCGLDYIYKGPYVWNETKWEYLGKKK